jgi:F-type H+-transporting ATPase subunit b
LKPLTVNPWKIGVSLVLPALIGLWAGAVWAADAASGTGAVYDTALSRLLTYMQENYTRATWDYVMRWVNFAILAGLIIKYARTPLINFLKEKKAETARAIQRFEAQKLQAEEKIRDARIQLEASKQRLALIHERIVAEGKNRKETMIQEAKDESRLMLSAAHTRIDNQIQEAARTIKTELIDAAFDNAMDKLPRMITEDDHRRLLNQWMEEAGR